MYTGNWIQGELDAIPPGKGKHADKNRKGKQERLLHQLLGTEPQKRVMFRDPASMLGKK